MAIHSEIERFACDIAVNSALLRELKRVGTDRAKVVAFANSKGYAFSLEDVNQMAAAGQLTDEQVESVVGSAINAVVVKGDAEAYVHTG